MLASHKTLIVTLFIHLCMVHSSLGIGYEYGEIRTALVNRRRGFSLNNFPANLEDILRESNVVVDDSKRAEKINNGNIYDGESNTSKNLAPWGYSGGEMF